MDNLSKNLFYLRKLKGLKQDEIQAGKGFSRNTWSNYENGVSTPTLKDFIDIANYFEVSTDALLFSDMSTDVHLKEKMNLWKKQLKSTPKVTPNSTPKGANYPLNDLPLPVVNDHEAEIKELEFTRQIVTMQTDLINTLKQAHGTLIELSEAQKETISRLQGEIIELKQKTGPG